MTVGMAIQYTIVALIIIGACVYMVIGVRRTVKRGGSCCSTKDAKCAGCSLKSCCTDPARSKSAQRKAPRTTCCETKSPILK